MLQIYRYQNKIPPLYIIGAGYFGAIKEDKPEFEEELNNLEEEEVLNNFKKLKAKREKRKNKE